MNKPVKLPPMNESKRIALEAVLEEIQRDRAKADKERHERNTKSAIALGFSSWEEQCQIEWDEGVRLEAEYEQRLPEFAAVAGMTVEEYHRELYSNKDLIPPSPVPSFSQCCCEEHPNPWFCPATLLEYRSQDQPDFQDYEELNRTPIETLRIRPNSKSRRLDSETLERAWGMIGPITLPLPIWARAKSEILAMPRVDSTAPLGQNAPSLTSASLGDNSSLTTSVTTPRSPRNELKENTKSKSSKLHKPNRRRAPLTASEKRDISKIVKHSQPPAHRTRSHKVALFYELDYNGHLKPSRGS